MDALGHKVLEALATGAPLSRGAIARMVGVEATSAVLGNVLGKLRRDRQIVMDGQKRNARYMAA
jgi:alkylated DNA nucleotide flippase Atl1